MNVAVLGGWAPSLLRFRGPFLAELAARGHRVIALAPDQDEATTQGLVDLGVEFRPVELERAGSNPAADLRGVAQLARALQQTNAQMFFGYTIKPIAYGALAAKLVGIKHRAAMVTGLGYAFAEPSSFKHRVVSSIAQRLLAAGLGACGDVFFQNPDDQALFAQKRLLGAKQRVHLVRGSGVDTKHYAVAPLPSGPLQFVFIGRLLADKGIREYIAMASAIQQQHPECRFRVAGWVDANPNSVSQAELDKWQQTGVIEYLGAVDDVRPVIGQSHVLVLPSYREGTPRSVLEAMSMGRAIITTDAPGCRETTVDGETGFLVEVRSAASLISAGRKLVETPGLAAKFGAAGRARIEQLYDSVAVARFMADRLGA